MDNQQFVKLFDRFLNKESSEQETCALFEYINDPENKQQVIELLGEKLNDEIGDNSLPIDEQRQVFDRIINQETQTQPKIRLVNWIKVAAAALIFILPLAYLLTRSKSTEDASVPKNKMYQKDIQPGSNKAILTLGDGSQIVLNSAKNGMLVRQGNVKVVKQASGLVAYNKIKANATAIEYNTMTTPRGGQYNLILSDGTKVWLNAASSITYPTVFTGKERHIELTGEAYFEVAKNKKMPFSITAKGTRIEVLGTHFNVMAYRDESNLVTTLLEGAVKLSKAGAQALLKPGQQAVLADGQAAYHISDSNTDEALAWKNGYFMFDNENIQGIMKKIQRWYDVDVTYKGIIRDQDFGGTISRFSNVSEVLRTLELTGTIHFKTEGRMITVMP